MSRAIQREIDRGIMIEIYRESGCSEASLADWAAKWDAETVKILEEERKNIAPTDHESLLENILANEIAAEFAKERK